MKNLYNEISRKIGEREMYYGIVNAICLEDASYGVRMQAGRQTSWIIREIVEQHGLAVLAEIYES